MLSVAQLFLLATALRARLLTVCMTSTNQQAHNLPPVDDAGDKEKEKPKSRWSRTAHLWLLAALLVDVVVPSTVGTICGPHCPSPASSGLVFFLRKAWWHGPYLFGASSLDLWAAAVGRLFAYMLLSLLRLRLTRWAAPPPLLSIGSSSHHVSPLLAPLNAGSLGGSDAASPMSAGSPGEVSAPWLRAKYAGYVGWALSGLTWSHGTAKGFGRLLSAGDPAYGSGFGLLPIDGTTPPEAHFWVCIGVAMLCAEIERRAFVSLSAKRPEPPLAGGAAEDDEEAGAGGSSSASTGRGGSNKTTAEDAADAASAAKQRYIKASEPAEVNAIAVIYRMMLPDAHLLLLAYISLGLAAFGESLVPLLYGQVIDAIAIYPDTERFHKYLLYLIGTAALTGIFTGLRGSTFIFIGGRFGARLRTKLFEALLKQEVRPPLTFPHLPSPSLTSAHLPSPSLTSAHLPHTAGRLLRRDQDWRCHLAPLRRLPKGL